MPQTIGPAARLAMVAAFGAMVAAPAAAQTVLRFAQLTPKTHFYQTDILDPWIADIARVTEGRVKIEVSAAPLGPFPRMFDLAKTGVADIAAGNHGVIAGRFPIVQIAETPFEEDTNPEAMSVALWRTQQKFLEPVNEHAGTQLLALHTSGSMHLFSRVRPVTKKSDFDGLKVMAPGKTGATFVEKMGGIPVIKSVPEYYDTISKGIVDAALATNTSVAGWKAEEFIKYQSRVPGGMLYGSFFVVMNKAAWDKLGPRDRDAIMKVSGETYAKRAGRVFSEQDAKSLEARRERIQVVGATPELRADIVKAFSFVDDEWLAKAKAAGIDGKAALDYFHEQVRTYKPSTSQ